MDQKWVHNNIERIALPIDWTKTSNTNLSTFTIYHHRLPNTGSTTLKLLAKVSCRCNCQFLRINYSNRTNNVSFLLTYILLQQFRRVWAHQAIWTSTTVCDPTGTSLGSISHECENQRCVGRYGQVYLHISVCCGTCCGYPNENVDTGHGIACFVF